MRARTCQAHVYVAFDLTLEQELETVIKAALTVNVYRDRMRTEPGLSLQMLVLAVFVQASEHLGPQFLKLSVCTKVSNEMLDVI